FLISPPSFFYCPCNPRALHPFPTRRSSDLQILAAPLDGRDPLPFQLGRHLGRLVRAHEARVVDAHSLEAPPDERGLELPADALRSEEHTSELQSPYDLVCRLLLEKKKKNPV